MKFDICFGRSEGNSTFQRPRMVFSRSSIPVWEVDVEEGYDFRIWSKRWYIRECKGSGAIIQIACCATTTRGGGVGGVDGALSEGVGEWTMLTASAFLPFSASLRAARAAAVGGGGVGAVVEGAIKG